ncbi:uncharacterized protein IL334_001668 [Kwoniella shivajii]|uniref:Uncharacterized protein n=1 Tax=Kwoniella shivajii TaxID=564305 RepID=A0ABZ1CSJ6_9TREE|nr:hypothetical protein IL334_001668 [Kwoniella shivajii]
MVTTSSDTAHAIPIIPEIISEHCSQYTYSEYLQALIEKGYIRFPLSESDLSKWCSICNQFRSRWKGSLRSKADIAAVDDFCKLLAKNVVPAPEKVGIEDLEIKIMKQVTSEIGKLAKRMDSLEETVIGLSSRAEQMDEAILSLQSQQDDKRISAVEHLVFTQEKTEAESGALVLSSSTNHPQLTSDGTTDTIADNVILTYNIRLNTMIDKLESTRTLYERIDARIDRLDAKVDRNDIKADTLTNKYDQTIEELKIIQNDHLKVFEDQKDKIDRLEKVSKEQWGVINHTNDNMRDIDGNFNKLEKTCKIINEKVQGEARRMEEGTKKMDEFKQEFALFVEQVNVREMNRVLLEGGRWLHPLPTMKGLFSPEGLKAFPNSRWAFWHSDNIRHLSSKDLDKWLEAYQIGADSPSSGENTLKFLNDVPIQVKRAILSNFVGGSCKPSFFKK